MLVRAGVRVGAAVAVAVAAVGAAGCQGSGTASPAPASASGAARPAAARFTAALAPGFSAAPSWSQTVPWSGDAISYEGTALSPDQGLMGLAAMGGIAQVVGSSVAMLSVGAQQQVSATGAASLQFRSLASGRLVNSVSLGTDSFNAMSLDTVDGRPVLKVQTTSSTPADEQSDGGQPLKVLTVYGADGSLVWTSRSKQVAQGPYDSSGLEGDNQGWPVYAGGYTLRYNGTTDMDDPAQGFDVLAPDGSVALHVPRYTDTAGDAAFVSLQGGYALVSSNDLETAESESDVREQLTAYKLGPRATKAGAWSEPGSPDDGDADLLTSWNGRLLAAWLGPGQTSFAVLDTAGGAASAVTGAPGGVAVTSLDTLLDPATGDALLYDANGQNADTFLIGLADAHTAWAQAPSGGSLEPVSMHDGTLYALTLPTTTSPLTLESVRESDGTVTARGYQAAPLGFAADGSAVFAQAASSTAVGPLRVGLSPRS